MTKTVKVAVIGSGLAGLTASYLLDQETQEITGQDDKNIEVHLFEKASRHRVPQIWRHGKLITVN